MTIDDNAVMNVFNNSNFYPDESNHSLTQFQTQHWIPYPTGIARFLARVPLIGYRMGFGDLLNGAHLMVLTTRGRRTRQPRHTPIEYRRHGKKVYIVSAWGSRPHWVQNILSDPSVTIQLGGKTFQARGKLVTDVAEATRALYLFRRIAPIRYDAVLGRLIEADVNVHTLPDQSSQFTILRLDLTNDAPIMPGVSVNLTWLWPLGLFAAFGGAVVFGMTKLRRSV